MESSNINDNMTAIQMSKGKKEPKQLSDDYPITMRLSPNTSMVLHNLLADLIADSRNPLLKVDDAVRIALEGYYKKPFNEILKEVQQKVQQRKLV